MICDVNIDECLDSTICDGIPDSTCQDSMGSYDCVCNTGFKKNSSNLCEIKTECSQLNCTTGTCVTTNNGEEYCTCPNGYNLTMVDNVTGICESTNVRLLYTTSADIILLDTETGVATNIAIGNNNSVYYIAYHYTTGYVYWTNMSAGTISRYILVVSLLLLQLSSFISNR